MSSKLIRIPDRTWHVSPLLCGTNVIGPDDNISGVDEPGTREEDGKKVAGGHGQEDGVGGGGHFRS